MRKEDWLERMHEYLDSVYDKPFKWGEHDCCLFAAACVEAMTGTDYMEDYRGAYDSQETAKEALKGKTLYATVKKMLGKPVHLAQVSRGDVVYHVFDTGPATGISIGKDALFVGSEGRDGLVTVPVLQCSKGFRI